MSKGQTNDNTTRKRPIEYFLKTVRESLSYWHQKGGGLNLLEVLGALDVIKSDLIKEVYGIASEVEEQKEQNG